VIALAGWIVFAAVVATIVAVDPMGRSATKEYQMASERWWEGEKSIYRRKNGFLYLPQWAIFYTPFEVLPRNVGEPLWRLIMLGSLAGAIWVAAGRAAPDRRELVFLVASVVMLPSALASARNGQVNMPLAAIYLLCAVTLADRRWIATAGLLALALALKPISIVPILLGVALFPRLRLPMVGALAVLFAIPFAHWNPAYAANEYREFVECLLRAGKPTGHTWCDFAGMLRSFGLPLADAATLPIRAVFAVVTLGIALRMAKITDPYRAAFAVMLLSTVYLMLFNPRTETNSYIMLGVFVGIWAAHDAVVAGRYRAVGLLVLAAVIFGTENYGGWIFRSTNLWLKALTAAVIGVWLARETFRRPVGDAVVLH
jgi:hypothetical protein